MNGSATRLAVLGVAGSVALFWTTRIVLPGEEASMFTLDLVRYFVPVYAALYGSLAEGVVPLWNPYELSGLPVLASPAAGFFYPPHVLYLLLPTHIALAASGLLHLLFSAITTLWLLRRVGATATAAVLAGLLFSLRGEVPQMLFLAPCRLEAAAWLPLGCIAILDLATPHCGRGPRWRALTLLSVATAASWLAGFPQTTIYVVYAWGALLLALLLGGRAPLRLWGFSSLCFGGALALGTLVASIQILPLLELASIGTRATGALGLARMYPLGDPSSSILASALSGTRPALSVVALSLAPAALLWPRHRAIAVWALGLSGLAFAFALGRLTPLFELYLALPTLSWFRHPYRVLMLTSFGTALVAALGLSSFARAAGAAATGPRANRAAIVGVTALGALALAGLTAWTGQILSALVACAMLLIALTSPWWGSRTGAGTVGLVVLGLAAAEIFLAPANRIALPYTAARAGLHPNVQTTLEGLGRLAGHDRVWLLRPTPMPFQFSEKLAPPHGLRSFTGLAGLNVARQASYYDFLDSGSTRAPGSRGVFQGGLSLRAAPPGSAPISARHRLADLAAVRYVAVSTGGSRLPVTRAFVRDTGLVTRGSAGQLLLFENPSAMPRAYAVYRTRPAPSEQALLEAMSREDFDPLREAFVEGDAPFEPSSQAPERGHPVQFVNDERHVVELEAELAAPGLVVLADTYYPGWRASVDGTPARIVPTNHLYRGVAVPAGRHRVRFEYRPASVVTGAVASLVGLAALGATWGLGRRPRSADRPE